MSINLDKITKIGGAGLVWSSEVWDLVQYTPHVLLRRQHGIEYTYIEELHCPCRSIAGCFIMAKITLQFGFLACYAIENKNDKTHHTAERSLSLGLQQLLANRK